jgi:hypothetical protein
VALVDGRVQLAGGARLEGIGSAVHILAADATAWAEGAPLRTKQGSAGRGAKRVFDPLGGLSRQLYT